MRISQQFADSNTGRKRRQNEDSFVCEPPLFAVADGMGGARAGEVASSIAAAALREGNLDSAGEGEARVVELIETANRLVHQRALDDASVSGMGTTMTVALFKAEGAVVFGHVGDSRAYVLRDGRLEQLTDDHSLVAELVRRGELSPEEAEAHPQRSVITRALGTDPDVDVDAFSFPAQAGDVFLLCSDGLTTMVDVDTIAEIVKRNRHELEAASHSLIKAANDRGGEDNITTVLFSVEEDDEARGTAELQAAAPAPEPDEEDTLHPEDRVMPPVEPALADDTMVVSAEELRAALAEDPLTDNPLPDNTLPGRPVVRTLLALVVVAALIGAIVLLLMKGLTR